MTKGLLLIIGISALFVLSCGLLVISDIAKTIYHQFKGSEYDWYTIKVLKQKREWWKWALAIGTFAVGAYSLLPNSLVGKADFRAYKEKGEYTAFYRCQYDINHFSEGDGYVEIEKRDGTYIIKKIYTHTGSVLVDYEISEDDDMDYAINLSFCSEDDSSVRIGDGPIPKDQIPYMDYAVVFGYPDPTKDYCRSCRACGSGYYGCTDSSPFLCPECTEQCQTSCEICFEVCPPWQGIDDDYVICEYCLYRGFLDEDLRYYFSTGEWP